jgi:hypothetical protein
MSIAEPLPGSGWLPIDAIDDIKTRNDVASQDAAKRLLGLSPQVRVTELMRLAAAGATSEPRLRSDDLARVLHSFGGSDRMTSEELRHIFPNLVLDPDQEA